MHTFPVISSTISADALAPFVAEAYNLEVNTCKLLKTGINHSYLIKAGEQKFVFRIYSLDWRSKTEIAEEIRLLNLLRDNGIPVSYAIHDTCGNHIQELNAPEGMRYGVLFSFAEGEKLLNLSADVHHTIGRTMAQMHQLTEGLTLQRVTYTADVMLQQSLQQLKKYLPADTEEMQWMLSTQKILLGLWNNVDTDKVRTGAVHMDIWFDNLNVTADGKVTLFDFDFCGNGWLCLDIAYYVLQVYSTEKVEAYRDEKLKSFFEGYESITIISEEEKRLLPMLGVSMYYFYLGIQSQRFENWANVFLNETYLKRFITVLVKKYFDDHVYIS
ncbi:aminoglycoside phosphotransferase [Mucilaginibacter conchicola]|uniref:Aminoglycoside phosphotransferase n=1 Tax=Mucilaginibacter conchicola TaxID=2303333 RepID=A0A372NRZ1_9SPHI|nr:phosphotransferase [Mucilaginibacter conchicola]RFZ92018.1 aminoglycoside phosphotransferase [Mucilaginibacter conchicola]